MMYQLNSCFCLLGRRKQVLSIWKSSLSCLMSVFGVVVWSFTILGTRAKNSWLWGGGAGRSHDPCWKIVSIMTEQKHSSRSISIDNRLWRSAMMMKITVCPRAGWGVVLVSRSLSEASHWPVSPPVCPLIGQCWHDNKVWLLKLNTRLHGFWAPPSSPAS